MCFWQPLVWLGERATPLYLCEVAIGLRSQLLIKKLRKLNTCADFASASASALHRPAVGDDPCVLLTLPETDES